MLPVPEGEALNAAGDLGFPDASTPSQMTDSVSAMAGTSPSRSSGLLGNLSRRIVPSLLGWPGWGSARSDPVVASGSLGQPRPVYDASMSVRTVDGVPDSARISVQAPFVDTPRFGVVQSQFRQGGRLTAVPGTLFGSPLGTDREAMELVNINPVYAAAAVMDHAYVDSVVQGTGSAGYAPVGTNVVGKAQSVPVPAPGAATAVVPVGSADLVPAQSGFQVSSVGYVPANYASLGLGQRMPTPVVSTVSSMELVPAYAGPVRYVTTAPTTVVSSTNFGYGFDGVRPPASVPASFTGFGTAGIGPLPVKNSMGGSVGSPVVSGNVHPSVGSGTVAVAGPLGSAGVPQGAPGMMPGACPVSRAVAPPAPIAEKPAVSRTETGSGHSARKSLMKLSRYDGTSSLETFLAKFTSMADYMNWNESDCYHHLCACLDGVAGQILWDVGPDGTVDKIITLLRTRFGNELQSERFRTELKARHRQPRETLQPLYLDISKLVALAYPGSTAELSNHVAKEAFLEALGDPQLQLKVLEREPKTVVDALAVASRMEAYEASVIPHHYDGDGGDRKHKHKLKSTYAVEGKEQPAPGSVEERAQAKAQIECQLAELQVRCNENREALGRLKAQKEAAERRAKAAAKAAEAAQAASPPASINPAPNQGGSGSNQYRAQGNYRGRGRGRFPAGQNSTCHNCGQQGHWSRDCPMPPAPISVPAPATAPQLQPPAPTPASGTQAVDYKPDRGWVQAEFRDIPIKCMIDTGIEWAALGVEFVKGLPTLPARKKETVVCGVTLPIVARTCISFRLAEHIMVARVDLITGVEGLVPGQTWYRENACVWNVKTG